jgi:hypothetical protein
MLFKVAFVVGIVMWSACVILREQGQKKLAQPEVDEATGDMLAPPWWV